MNLRSIKFYDKERHYIFETKVSINRCFCNYIGHTLPSGFSDCDFTPQPERYVPILTIGRDRSGKEITTNSIVKLHHPDTGEELKGKIVYEENNCCFSIDFGKGLQMPLLGICEYVEVVGEFLKHNDNEMSFK